ncbi:hypothetical protein E2C01_092791 [Portunus trituberculatus]|uniref:Uncharacterized protein n=1 Tax=Portunus trituberculatus TaxID=210409 RepID=A0A5B7JYN3_PORTR|nr:hypothetical protein [Portunus trituberculatus]
MFVSLPITFNSFTTLHLVLPPPCLATSPLAFPALHSSPTQPWNHSSPPPSTSVPSTTPTA